MNTQKMYRKLKKNSKGLSPVVASIILIAVTVAVSVVVAAWMGGMTIGLMGNAEQATISNLDFAQAGHIGVTVQNTGDADITITNAYVNTAATTNPFMATIGKGNSTTADLVTTWIPGTEYTIKLTTSSGNNLVLTATAP
ncbi:MAG TPA: archaellin/type IV pilin N-terminal domain-containing protein [Candidatus Acidoferrales bacterium]|nr:archaellin/type IV pilin N-terminal domain-containing protein [Candidatus Acidoferrales bacterium]